MDEIGRRPVARLWELTGGYLHDPDVARAVCEVTVPRVREQPGYLGALILLDTEHSTLRGHVFWDCRESESASRDLGGRAAAAMEGLTSASKALLPVHEVVLSIMVDSLGHPSQMSEVEHVVARTVRVEGDAASDTVETLRALLSDSLALLPGCVGVVLLHDPVRPAVVGISLWNDTTAARRPAVVALGASLPVVASGHTESTESTYHVMVNHPVRWPPAP